VIRHDACKGVCYHIDCEDVKGPPPCPSCGKPVPYLDGFHVHRGRGTVRLHFACYKPEAEPELPVAALAPELVVPEPDKPDPTP